MSFEAHIISKVRTGSREICNPAPTDTDEDFIILVDDLEDADMKEALWLDGWREQSGDHYPESEFASWRKGDVNYILTEDAEFFDRFVAATLLAKKFNLLKKADRIQLFHAVIMGEFLSDQDCETQATKRATISSAVETNTTGVWVDNNLPTTVDPTWLITASSITRETDSVQVEPYMYPRQPAVLDSMSREEIDQYWRSSYANSLAVEPRTREEMEARRASLLRQDDSIRSMQLEQDAQTLRALNIPF